MDKLEHKYRQHLEQRRNFCVLGVDDTPFKHLPTDQVPVAGVVCHNTRMEGLLWTQITRDGQDATAVLLQTISSSKFYAQLHLMLLDGIALGGFNVVDLPLLAEGLGLPCVAVMRRLPDLPAMQAALQKLGQLEHKGPLLERAGVIYQAGQRGELVYQVQGLDPELTGQILLQRLTDRGHVPEALRLAHLIGSAVALGESGRRA